MIDTPPSKNCERKNPLEKVSPRFFGIKTASSTLLNFQRAKLSTRSFTHFCWCNWRTFWRKNAVEMSPSWSRSCTTMSQLTRHLQPEKISLLGHPMSWSPTLFSGSGPVGLPPAPWTEKKNNWKFSIFPPTRRSFLPRRHGRTVKLLNFF